MSVRPSARPCVRPPCRCPLGPQRSPSAAPGVRLRVALSGRAALGPCGMQLRGSRACSSSTPPADPRLLRAAGYLFPTTTSPPSLPPPSPPPKKNNLKARKSKKSVSPHCCKLSNRVLFSLPSSGFYFIRIIFLSPLLPIRGESLKAKAKGLEGRGEGCTALSTQHCPGAGGHGKEHSAPKRCQKSMAQTKASSSVTSSFATRDYFLIYFFFPSPGNKIK